MRPGASLLAAALVAGGAAVASEGGPIRSGEHEGFTRLVVRIDPRTEWSLETSDGLARLTFPGRSLALDASRVFDRIPATRVLNVDAAEIDGATVVEVALGCDCRVSASFVGGQYLALDVADRADRPTALRSGPDGAFMSAVEGAISRAERESVAVTSAEEILIRQIERAAGQGVIEMRPSEAGEDRTTTAAVAPPQSEPAATALLDGGVQGEAPPADGALSLLDHEQIRARTVLDEAGRGADHSRIDEPAEAACLDDASFDLAGWSDGAPLMDQLAALRRRIVAEFDAADHDAVADLARLYLHFGFGLEAEGLLVAFDQHIDDDALLADLARAVEGRPIAPGGPLSIGAACRGAHALWIALGGSGPAHRDATTFGTLADAFAQLPPDLRAMLGPRLAERLVAEEEPEAARRILSIAARSGLPPGPESRLVAARLTAADGDPDGAIAALMALIDENAPNAGAALAAAVELGLAENHEIPDALVTELRAAIVQFRGSASEPDLRSLLARALAQNGDLAEAIETARALQDELAAESAADLRVELLTSASAERVGESHYARTALAELSEIADVAANDPARRTIARRLLDLGLPEAAILAARPALRRNDTQARRIVAEAHLALGRPYAALAILGDLDSQADADLRARALAAVGDFDAAVAALDAEGFGLAADDYAWASGDWDRALEAAADPLRAAMASFMVSRGGVEPQPETADAPDASSAPETAFAAPLPDLGRPSLRSAQQLLANGAAIGDFVLEVLHDPSQADQPD